MMRRISAVLALACLLFGCGEKTGETVCKEPVERSERITVTMAAQAREFDGFTAGPAGVGAEDTARMVEEVLECYPDGLKSQLGAVEILLVGGLTGREDYAHGGYAGFTQRQEDGWLVVLDWARCDAGTVHHELAHVLDGILTESGALIREEWMQFCPGGFSYGDGDWARYPDFFADGYAMTDIREDRARTFEEAVLGGEGVYDDRPALWLKLECFSRAIRSHFDTSLWPEKTIWEMALD